MGNPYWGHLERVENTGNTLVSNGNIVTLAEGRQLWKENTLEKWEW